jgi:hypothetical protein
VICTSLIYSPKLSNCHISSLHPYFIQLYFLKIKSVNVKIWILFWFNTFDHNTKICDRRQQTTIQNLSLQCTPLTCAIFGIRTISQSWRKGPNNIAKTLEKMIEVMYWHCWFQNWMLSSNHCSLWLCQNFVWAIWTTYIPHIMASLLLDTGSL